MQICLQLFAPSSRQPMVVWLFQTLCSMSCDIFVESINSCGSRLKKRTWKWRPKSWNVERERERAWLPTFTRFMRLLQPSGSVAWTVSPTAATEEVSFSTGLRGAFPYFRIKKQFWNCDGRSLLWHMLLFPATKSGGITIPHSKGAQLLFVMQW